MTIEIGWWLIPAAITLAAYVWFHITAKEDYKTSGYMTGLGAAIAFLAFGMISGMSWAIYFAIMYFTK